MDKINHVAVKEVVFPFIKLPDVDPVLTPEMKSTGEVIGMDMDYAMAYYKAQIAAENELPLHGSVFLSVNKKDRKKIISLARKFNEMGFEIIATPGTSRNLRDAGVINRKILKISEGSPNILDLMKSKQISLIINTPTVGKNPMRDGYKIRSSAVKLNTPYITTIAGAQAAVNAIEKVREREIEVKSWNEYFNYPT